MGDQVDEDCLFTHRGIFQQLDQACGLFGVQREGRQAFLGALLYVTVIGLEHSDLLRG
jgi:hypothetical protein